MIDASKAAKASSNRRLAPSGGAKSLSRRRESVNPRVAVANVRTRLIAYPSWVRTMPVHRMLDSRDFPMGNKVITGLVRSRAFTGHRVGMSDK